MSLPLLPGQVFDRKLGQEKFHKSHCFDYMNDVSVHVGEYKAGIGGHSMPGGKKKPNISQYPKGDGSPAPAWVAFDRQVLCFDAYFQESVHEKREEQFRIRKCKIYFYLEDDSVQVIESKVENSGIPQGTLVRRHRIPLPAPNDEEYFTVDHFNIGKELLMYAKTFHITDCDNFTKNFLRKLGVTVNDPMPTPGDPYSSYRNELQESLQPLRPYEKADTRRQFLENDRRVLRFYCFWDDTDNMFGDPRECVLHYFLADDTVEIREIIPPNSGRDAVPLFLRRQRMPKAPTPLNQPGEITERTVLNVFGPMGAGGRYILDSLKTGAVHTEFYTDADFTIGTIINVWGRQFMLCNCDEFTNEYYKTKYGIEEQKPIEYKDLPKPKKDREMPPYNGFGSEEDSLCNCLSLIAKPPRRDFIKFMEKDRHGLDSNVIRFVAKLDTAKPIDCDRVFVIAYFLSDDTVLVYEPPQRNSGIIGGKFLERRRVKKPDGESYYTASDLYIGANVEFYKHKFILTDADEYAVNYMEKHPGDFPAANVNTVLPKLKDAVGSNGSELKMMLEAADRKKAGVVDYASFNRAVKQVAGDALSQQELITVARAFGDRKQHDDANQQMIIAAVQETLRKVNYENFSLMNDACVYHDQERTGFIPAKELRNIGRSFKLPIKDELLTGLLNGLTTNDQGHVDYRQFIEFLNWRDTPVAAQKFEPSLAFGVNVSAKEGPTDVLECVNYCEILKLLGL